jgi:hypothetical protein
MRCLERCRPSRGKSHENLGPPILTLSYLIFTCSLMIGIKTIYGIKNGGGHKMLAGGGIARGKATFNSQRLKEGEGASPESSKQFMVGPMSVPTRRGHGAPKGNRNALKHGRHTAPFLARRARTKALIVATRNLIRRIEMVAASRRALLLSRRGEGGGGTRNRTNNDQGIAGFCARCPISGGLRFITLERLRAGRLSHRPPTGAFPRGRATRKNQKQPRVQNGRSFPVQEHHAPQGARR